MDRLVGAEPRPRDLTDSSTSCTPLRDLLDEAVEPVAGFATSTNNSKRADQWRKIKVDVDVSRGAGAARPTARWRE